MGHVSGGHTHRDASGRLVPAALGLLFLKAHAQVEQCATLKRHHDIHARPPRQFIGLNVVVARFPQLRGFELPLGRRPLLLLLVHDPRRGIYFSDVLLKSIVMTRGSFFLRHDFGSSKNKFVSQACQSL